MHCTRAVQSHGNAAGGVAEFLGDSLDQLPIGVSAASQSASVVEQQLQAFNCPRELPRI
jgi:hypothetical protein